MIRVEKNSIALLLFILENGRSGVTSFWKAAGSSSITFLIITDQNMANEQSENIKFIKFCIKDFNLLALDKLKFIVNNTGPYKYVISGDIPTKRPHCSALKRFFPTFSGDADL